MQLICLPKVAECPPKVAAPSVCRFYLCMFDLYLFDLRLIDLYLIYLHLIVLTFDLQRVPQLVLFSQKQKKTEYLWMMVQASSRTLQILYHLLCKVDQQKWNSNPRTVFSKVSPNNAADRILCWLHFIKVGRSDSWAIRCVCSIAWWREPVRI